MASRSRIARAVALACLLLAVPVAGANAADTAGFPGLKKRLTGQSKKLVAFTADFKATPTQYNKLGRGRELRLRRAVGAPSRPPSSRCSPT